MSEPDERYVVELGTGTVAHIVDMSVTTPEPDDPWALEPEPPGEKLCSRGTRRHRFERITFDEYAERQALDQIEFTGEPPEGLCSYCWTNLLETLEQEHTDAEDELDDRIGEVGYRLRWKQKGRARDEWYDIVVRPETTMAELDRLVCRFTTLDDLHLRMYGLEDEYLDSSLEVLPDHQFEQAGHHHQTKASELTIADVAERGSLREGDRLSLVYDFGTPSHYYCIVKETYGSEEIDAVVEDADVLSQTDTAAVVKEKRP